jgi:hypothetical protein
LKEFWGKLWQMRDLKRRGKTIEGEKDNGDKSY